MTQGKSLLLGSAEDIDALAQKNSARLLAISDSHGNRDALCAIVKSACEANMCEALVFCGDGLSDLFFCAEKCEATEFPKVAAFVAGNNDVGRYAVRVPLEQTFVAAGKKIFVSHGHLHHVYYTMHCLLEKSLAEKADVAFYGHTHIAAQTNSQGVCLVNPGSLAYPRTQLPPSFALVSICGGNISTEFYRFEIKDGRAIFGSL